MTIIFPEKQRDYLKLTSAIKNFQKKVYKFDFGRPPVTDLRNETIIRTGITCKKIPW